MLSQWLEIKESLDDEIVFCRVGDFYELFFDDAERATKILDLQLTKRKISDSHYPMAGVPVRSLDTYVARLVDKGYKVAIIDQLEDAKQSTGMLKRGLTKIITRGTITEEVMLSPGKNNYLASLYHQKNGRDVEFGIALCDISTGDFRVGTFHKDEITELLRAYSKFSPVEIIHLQDLEDLSYQYQLPFDNEEIFTPKPSFWFAPEHAETIVHKQFGVSTVEGFGLKPKSAGLGAAGALLRYLQETQFTAFPHIQTIRSLDVEGTMILDATAIRSLELFENTQDHTSHATLLELMDETVTPMGGRLLRHWIANPLADLHKIQLRLESVELFQQDALLQHKVRGLLAEMGDIERLVTRISMGTAKPDELNKLAYSLEKIPDLRKLLEPFDSIFPTGLYSDLDPSRDFVHLIRKTIMDDFDGEVGGGGIITKGFNQELDRLRDIIETGESWLDDYIKEQEDLTGISSIKIKQNNHLGYFLDISKKELKKIPENYIRKQVMVNTTRYFTEELKNWETEILEAEVKILELEEQIYKNLLNELSAFTITLQKTSQSLAVLDCLSSFAYLADRNNYCKPEFIDSRDYYITAGRHPVIEALNTSQPYVPNDVILDYDTQRINIITGPNFSGKSSLLRAVGLIAIMAQMGSYVPAEKVEMGIVDRIFTRIGASDNLVAGQSTFMLEMIDAANLVNNSTDRSLVIADELGRGTSTYDGLAIAWSIAEYLHKKPGSPKTLIATHYHQLSELEDILPAVKNFQFVIRFEDDKPIFDHKLEHGSSDKSFGVEVAKLSGLPNEVIDRGKMILELLESKAAEVDPKSVNAKKLSAMILSEDGQSSLENWFGSAEVPATSNPLQKPASFHPVLKKLKAIDPMELNPMQALQILLDLKELVDHD